MPPLQNEEYTVGWICALPIEMAAGTAMLDEEHGTPLRQSSRDKNNYCLGRIGHHNVVVACLPSGVYGTTSAAGVAHQMLFSFPLIKIVLMVGIGGGNPSARDLRLGDVVISKPRGQFGGVVQYDFGKVTEGGKRICTSALSKPPPVLLTAIASLEAAHLKRGNNIPMYLSEMLKKYPHMAQKFSHQGAENDRLFKAEYNHVDPNSTHCDECDSSRLATRPVREDLNPVVFYGVIASGNQVVKDGVTRDRLARESSNSNDVLCFEMEAAGLMDSFPCLVIRGISDYADSHKNKRWQEYAAATAAACGKELLESIPASDFDLPPEYSLSGLRLSSSSSDMERGFAQPERTDSETMPSSTFIFTSRLYAKDDVPLASLVPDRRYPNQDGYAPLPVDEATDFSVAVDKNFCEPVRIKSTPSDLSFKKAITKLFMARNPGDDILVMADESRVYMLRQPTAFFQRICKLEEVQNWFTNSCLQHQDVYFIIGYRTLRNARLVPQEGALGSSPQKSPPPRRGMAKKDGWSMVGERVYATCYRKVTFKRVAGRDSAMLKSSNRWVLSSKGRLGEEEGADEFIAADIEDDDDTGESVLRTIATGTGEEIWTSLEPRM